MANLADMYEDLQSGLAGTQVLAHWADRDLEWRYYTNKGHDLVPQREVEDLADYNRRPKVGIHLTYKVVQELSKGLYGYPGPVRKVSEQSADQMLQLVDQEHNLNAVMQKADSLAWLHGFGAIQCTSNLKYVRERRVDLCPVRLRTWRADECYAMVEDDDPTDVWGVITREVSAQHQQVTLKVWTNELCQHWVSHKKDMDIFGDRTSVSSIIHYNPVNTDRFQLVKTEPNVYGVIPFVFFRNDPWSGAYDDAGLGEALLPVHQACDQLLSDCQQAIQVYLIPEKYASNVQTSTRWVNRVGNALELLERDPAKDAKVFFVQPELRVEETWLHVQYMIREALDGLDVPWEYSIQTVSTPESGVALIIRRIPLIQKWMARRQIAKIVERDLVRLVSRVWGTTVGDSALALMADSLDVEVDYAEPSMPIPSPEKDISDSYELELGLKSRVQMCMERTGRTREQALEFLEQVAKDEEEATPKPVQPTATPAEDEPVGAGDQSKPINEEVAA